MNSSVYQELRQDLFEFADKSLTHGQYRTLIFILNRTLRFDKDEEKIPYRHFLEGVCSSGGEPICGSAGLSKRSITNTLRELVGMGLIEVEVSAGIGINCIRVIVEKIRELITMAKLNISKRYRQHKEGEVAQSSTKGPEQSSTNSMAKEHQLISTGVEPKDEEPKDLIVRRSAPDIQSALEGVNSFYQNRRRVRSRKKEGITAKAFRLCYNDAIAQYRANNAHAPVSQCSTSEAAMFLKAVKSDRFYQSDGWKLFVTDAIVGWNLYTDHFMKDFGWGNVPDTPSFSYFLKTHARFFAPFYVERKTQKGRRYEERQDRRLSNAQWRAEKAEQENAELRDRLAMAEKNQRPRALTKEQLIAHAKRREQNAASESKRTASMTFEEAVAAGDIPPYEDNFNA